MEGEDGLHWNNNKSVPLNTLDNSRTLAFTELQGQSAESSLFLIGVEHTIVKAQEIEKEGERNTLVQHSHISAALTECHYNLLLVTLAN